jgi:hypothetical protein
MLLHFDSLSINSFIHTHCFPSQPFISTCSRTYERETSTGTSLSIGGGISGNKIGSPYLC